MGKKSKNKNIKPTPCYHGCITKKDFNFGGHYKILEGWDKVNTVDIEEFVNSMEFINKNKRVMTNPLFARFVMARVTDDFLKGKDVATLRKRLVLLLQIRYVTIPEHEGKDIGPESEITKKFHKYMRDIQTERGRINIMAREIPCDCMEAKRIEAKSMERVALCFGCIKEIPKENMLRCKCDHVQYCSKECSKNHWPEHKKTCNKYNVSSATASTSASVWIPSSLEKPSDVDAEEE